MTAAFARTYATEDRDRLCVLIKAPVTVRVFPIAEVTLGELKRWTVVNHECPFLAALTADQRAALRSVWAEPIAGLIAFICAPIAVVIDAITVVIRAAHQRCAALDKPSSFAAAFSLAATGASAAADQARDEAFIDCSVTIAVDPITALIALIRVIELKTNRIAIAHASACDAALKTSAYTSPQAACNRYRRGVFVDESIAVFIDAIAAVTLGGLTWDTLFNPASSLTASLPTRCTGAESTANHLRGRRLIDHAITVIIEAIAECDLLLFALWCERARVTTRLVPDAAEETGLCTAPFAKRAWLTWVFVNAPITVIVNRVPTALLPARYTCTR